MRSRFPQTHLSSFPTGRPDSQADKSELELCLTKELAAAANLSAASPQAKEDQMEMLSATKRWIDRDLTSDGEWTADRDRSMFQSFQWQQQRLPKNSKMPVWAATVHVAKRGNPTWGDQNGTNLGTFIHQEFGSRALTLGFSAIGGSFRLGKGHFQPIPRPPADSVEAFAFRRSNADAVYIGPKKLKARALGQEHSSHTVGQSSSTQ